MVDLGGYVIILVETKDKKIKLYGSPADKDNLEVGDEIMEVNGKTLEDATHTEVISHIHQCIRSRTICLRVKRRSAPRLALDLELCASNVQDAFVIAVEQQARERLERLSALKRIKPVDMTKLSQQLNQQSTTSTPRGGPHSTQDNNSFIENSPIYVTSLSTTEPVNNNVTTSVTTLSTDQQQSVAAVTNSNYRKTSPLVSSSNDKGGSSTKPNGHIGNARETTDLILNQDLIGGGGGGGVGVVDANNRSVSVISAGSSGQATDVILPPVSPSNVNSERRASSPFINGRTEVLIGADENKFKTTALVETNNRLGIDTENRPRRRSGSSIVVLDGEAEPVKRPPDEVGDSYDTSSGFNMVMMLAGENGPHREMAVDVPDSFVGRNKTPPRYPPPKPRPQATVNDNNTAKPVPPPRDHLRIEKDGRLVNRAPAPQVPTRIANNNYVVNSSNKEPTKEQLESIRKFQEQLRKRREEEERLAQQTEFLNSSLRGSRKLQALESTPQPHGLVNDAYSSTEENEEEGEPVIVHQTISYGNLVASLQRLQLQTKKYPAASNLEGQIAAVQSLLLSPEFGRAIAVHNAVQEARTNFASTTGVSAAPENNAQIIVRDCLDSLGSCSSAAATELADLLTGYEMEGLMSAHDSIVDMLDSESIFLQEKIIKSNALEDNTRTNDSVSEQYTDSSIKIIKIEKTNEPLGATVLNQGDAVIIGRIVRGGAADKSGLLHEGDEVLEVNGVEMRGKSVNAVCDILASMQGTLTFLVVPAANARTNSQRDTVLHVKAHFDYDPEDDVLIPCRELGISFQKGDVLHIISQEDPNWWQAYREGEEDQTLAGLVPSMSFQHQRETMKRSAIGDDKGLREKPQKTGTLLCARKTPKKKKKKGPYNEGGYPLYTTTVDEYDMEEILTYEEVALYYPRANHKRPIVLIGPPNIGRHELRQRLMEDSERFAAAIPHTSRARKDSEIDGQDYHFITRAQFEADIVARKFVEHGEYEKAYYGTSLDAIRSVVNSGKICVLNLHPQSLRILRTSDLKPYIVFVAPPSLEKLRQKKIRNGEAFKEEELKDIIEKAREMEDKYGHFFDMIIINNDTERAYHQLLSEINSLEREPQWVPAAWVKAM